MDGERERDIPGKHSLILHVAVFTACFLVLFGIRAENQKLFHVVAEMVSIAIAYGIFMLVWPARRLLSNDMLMFLGFVYLVVGTLDLAHTLSYRGMGLIAVDDANPANPATQMWIIARYLESASLLAAPVFLKRRFPKGPAFIVSAAVTAGAIYAVFVQPVFPDCFVEGQGLTTFKVVSEYIIIAIVGAAIVRLHRQRERMQRYMYRYLLVSMVFTILAELSFTMYTDVYDTFNVLGHAFKIISFYYIYKALIENGLNNPLDVLFADLRNRKERLEEEVANRARTEENLRQITGDLNEGKRQVEERLKKLTEERNRLVAELSATVLKKSDIIQNNSRLLKELQNCNYEKEILYEQLNYYLRIVEQSESDIGKLIE